MATERSGLGRSFVDWSTHSAEGLETLEAAECMASQDASVGGLTWWAGDFCSVPSSPEIGEWLRDQQARQAVILFPNIGVGAGSVVWINPTQLGTVGLLGMSRQTLHIDS